MGKHEEINSKIWKINIQQSVLKGSFMNKKSLFLLLIMVCSQYILGDSKNIDFTGLSPEKKVLVKQKIREIQALEKELAHYGSEQPAITNTRLGLVGIFSGVAI